MDGLRKGWGESQNEREDDEQGKDGEVEEAKAKKEGKKKWKATYREMK